MKRQTRESPWNFYETVSLRHWFKGRMTPIGYDKALKRKERFAVYYCISAFVFLNYVAYKNWVEKKNTPTVEPEHKDLHNILSITHPKNTEIISYEFDGFKLKSVERYDLKEIEPATIER